MSDYGPVTEAAIDSVVATAQRYGASSIIALSGVPGTGKSFVARIAAQRIADEPTRVRELQFHQSMTYEEFIEGLRINSDGGITVDEGLFLEWNTFAHDDPALSWVILVDELTRANVPAVLGELMTYIEDRDRVFTTTYSRRPVKVAKNLTIIATFNPVDRSALELDNALLRRLRQIEFPPDPGQLREMLAGTDLSGSAIDRIAGMFEAVAKKHASEYERLMPFGHGVFAEVQKEQPDLYQLWHQRLKHFLYRPLMPPHQFSDTIRANYPWTDPAHVEP